MDIEMHGFVVVVHGMKKKQLARLCRNYLKIDIKLFSRNERRNCITLEYKFGKKKSVYINHYKSGIKSQTNIELNGSFFDNASDFKMDELLHYISKFKWTPKQLDVAYVDDKKCLDIKKIRKWCGHSKKYCNGSLVRTPPLNVYSEGKFCRIQLNSATSKTNYGTIYVRPDTGFIRIEIKFKSKEKIHFMMDRYKDIDPKKFKSNSLKLLVGCIDFVTAKSKRTRKPESYVKQGSWKAFLGSDIKKVSWKHLSEQRNKNRAASDAESLGKKVKRAETMMRNLKEKYGEEEISRMLAENHNLNFPESYVPDFDVTDDPGLF